MGFNLLPLSVIPEIRLTDKGLVTVPEMEILPLFQDLLKDILLKPVLRFNRKVYYYS